PVLRATLFPYTTLFRSSTFDRSRALRNSSTRLLSDISKRLAFWLIASAWWPIERSSSELDSSSTARIRLACSTMMLPAEVERSRSEEHTSELQSPDHLV